MIRFYWKKNIYIFFGIFTSVPEGYRLLEIQFVQQIYTEQAAYGFPAAFWDTETPD